MSKFSKRNESMEQSYTRQSKLIKRINLAVWALLFLAGTILCQRVLSDHSVPAVAAVTKSGLENEDFASDTLPNAESSVQGAEEETTIDPPAAEPVKPKIQSTAATPIAPPRRVRPTTTATPAKVTRPEPTKTETTVLATSPITSHASTKKSPTKDALETDTVRPTTERNQDAATPKPAQSSISLSPSLPTKEPASLDKNKDKLTTKTAPKPPQVTTMSNTELSQTDRVNPRQLVVENPKKIGYPVSFLAGKDQQTLQPGEKFERILVSPQSAANIHFDRGGDFGRQSWT